MSGGGDSYYINEARRIQDNIQQLLLISSELSSGNDAGGEWLHGRLTEAKALATETHLMLKRFGVTASESSASSTERSQRRQTHKKLNSRYQSALKTLDKSGHAALRSGRHTIGSKLTDPNHQGSLDLVSANGLPALYPESAVGGWDSDEQSQASGSRCDVLSEDGRYRRRNSPSWVNKSVDPYDPPRTDFYRVAQPQFDPMPHSFDSPHVPYHQQILTYQPPKRSPMDKTRTFNNSSVELKNNQSSASTATGTLRSGSMGSRRDLEFFPVRMVKPDELQARLLAEEARGVLQIEKDVKGIRQLYQEMAWQVSNETDDLDAIESQMRSAVDLSTHSVGDLVDAHSMFQTHRRLRWYLITSLTVLFVLISFWILTRFF